MNYTISDKICTMFCYFFKDLIDVLPILFPNASLALQESCDFSAKQPWEIYVKSS